jgi:hypothetical protein
LVTILWEEARMATRSQQFRAQAQRDAHNAKPKARAKPKPRGRLSVPNPAGHNTAPRVNKTGRYELEVSAQPRPSRKQTRKSKNRQKTDNTMRIAKINDIARPRSRATRPTGNPI